MMSPAIVDRTVAVIPGDGIGPEVVSAALRVVDEALALHGGRISWRHYPWGSNHYHRTGRMMPVDGLDILARSDAIFFGAVGDPSIPDHITVWGLILPIRKTFDQFVNLRPIRWMEGIPPRLFSKRPADVDMVFVRENVEGEYADAGELTADGALQTAVFSRTGIDRVARFAFDLARERHHHVTSITKSNALRYSMVLWDEVVASVATAYPDVECRRIHVDAAAYEMVLTPERFDVVVASNLFGDILTDLGAALQGSLGVGASANLDPSHRHPSMFEPIHGSAPDIAGEGTANPAGAIWSAVLMLQHLGMDVVAARVLNALERAFLTDIATPDLGGMATTDGFAAAVLRELHATEQGEVVHD